MADITRSVGAGGDNLRHDVILVQLMLKKVKNQAPLGFGPMDKNLMEQFYVVRNEVAAAQKLYSTIKGGDFGHLQNYDDDLLDSVGSLIGLMELVGPRKMKWTSQYRKPTNYLCDLGLGGERRYVGTAHDIWTKDATFHISPADLATLLQAKLEADPKFSPDQFLGRSEKSALPADFTGADIKTADINAVQKMLRAEFEAAEANWKRWKPVMYPGKDRRPLNPRKH